MSNEMLIRSVKRKAQKLDKEMANIKGHEGSYVIYDGAQLAFMDSFGQAVNWGEKLYGNKTAFIVRKVGTVPSLSCLIKR